LKNWFVPKVGPFELNPTSSLDFSSEELAPLEADDLFILLTIMKSLIILTVKRREYGKTL
jgi:hypothetical protein